jgi:hypothetical protein
MAVAVASPIVVAGCAEHTTVRVYDPYYGDYYAWNDNEVVFTASGLSRLTGLTANFARCRQKSSGNIGTGATITRITTRN